MTSLAELRADAHGWGYADCLKKLREIEALALDAKPIRIAVLRSYTVEPIEPVLKLFLRLADYDARLQFGGYGQYTQEIVDPSSPLYAFEPEIVLLLLRLEDLLPSFVNDFGTVEGKEWQKAVEERARELGELAAMIHERSSAQVVIQNASMPGSPYFGAFDAQLPESQSSAVTAFNSQLAGVLSLQAGSYIWDYDRLSRSIGAEQIYDAKMWYYGKSPFRQSAYPRIAQDLTRSLLAVLGHRKKCVVLDLDNTLWGGVIGEDGIDGIALGHDYPGNCYRAFQAELLKLYHRGILLAINSKNNEADAYEVIDRHPDMILKREHFAAARINWNDKATNLAELAAELNIGPDSMIMLDDNPAECEQIRQRIPECEVVCLPDRPYLLPGIVTGLPGIDNLKLTAEDRVKGELYQQQAQRKRAEQSFADLDEFLQSLEMRIAISPASSFSIPRISQLTQKTNQFNMTTRRYSEADIERLAKDSNTGVFCVSAADKFGEHGIIAVIILRFVDARCLIDNFLMSCRVIGRNIETAILDFAVRFARDRGAEELVGEFLPSRKNAPAADVYGRVGFARLSDTEFCFGLDSGDITAPAYIEVSIEDEAAASGSGG